MDAKPPLPPEVWERTPAEAQEAPAEEPAEPRIAPSARRAVAGDDLLGCHAHNLGTVRGRTARAGQ
jgi:hypothetical protein